MRFTFDEFKQAVLTQRNQYLPEKYKNAILSIEHVDKLNHSYEALTVRMPGDSYGASYDLDQFYKEGKDGSIRECLERMGEQMKDLQLENRPDFKKVENLLKDYSLTEGTLFVRCSNLEKNRRILANCPCTKLGDLVFSVHVGINWEEETEPNYSALVTNHMMQDWGVDQTKLFEDALKSSAERLPAEWVPLDKILGTRIEPGQEGSRLYCLSNTLRENGAAVMLYPGVLDQIQKSLGDFYILPSSVHEVLLIPDRSHIPLKELENMVQEVNQAVVKAEDYLSDSVYNYDGKMKQIEKATDYVYRKYDEKTQHYIAGTEEKKADIPTVQRNAYPGLAV